MMPDRPFLDEDGFGGCLYEDIDSVNTSLWERNSIFVQPQHKEMTIKELTRLCMSLQGRIAELEKELILRKNIRNLTKDKHPFSDIWEDDGNDWWAELDEY